jgi:YHS domain-containing protein
LGDVSVHNRPELVLVWLAAEGAVMTGFSLNSSRRFVVVFLLSSFVTGAALAGSPIPAVNTEHGLAVKGYDPVAYFTTGRPTPGLPQFSVSYKAATYVFASAEDRDRFIAMPEKFLPQYGGYCAYAIALNQIADIDPDEWAIVDNKLYLNNNLISQTLWSFDKTSNIARGDHNWPLVPKLGNP